MTVLTRVLARLGTSLHRLGPDQWLLDTPDAGPVETDARLVRRMRASFCVLGPLLARRRRAVVACPAGAASGIDRSICIWRASPRWAPTSACERGCVVAQASRLRGATVRLAGPHGPTVTGTANVLCAATLAPAARPFCPPPASRKSSTWGAF